MGITRAPLPSTWAIGSLIERLRTEAGGTGCAFVGFDFPNFFAGLMTRALRLRTASEMKFGAAFRKGTTPLMRTSLDWNR
jgi:hypothetical protein